MFCAVCDGFQRPVGAERLRVVEPIVINLSAPPGTDESDAASVRKANQPRQEREGMGMVLNRVGYHARTLRDWLHVRYAIANFICGFFPGWWGGNFRARLYRWSGFEIGSDCTIMRNLYLVGGGRSFYQNLKIGSGVRIADGVSMSLDAQVSIGNNVVLSPFVRIVTASHEMGPSEMRCQHKVIASPVVIEDGCWLAIGVTVLPGVTIGRGSIIAAGAVVSENVPPDSLVGGMPGRVVKELPKD